MLVRFYSALALVISLAGSPAFGASDVVQFRMNASHNAVFPAALEAKWEVETGGPISASPTFADGTVFIGNNIGTLYAIDAATGRIKWKHHVSNDLMSEPLLYHGLVIVGEGNANSVGPAPGIPLVVGSGLSAIIAFDERTGAIRWRKPLHGSGMPTPAIINGVLVHHDGAGWIAALDPLTGSTIYEKNLHSVASMTAALPVGDGDFVTAGVMGNAVWRIDARTGHVVWHTDLLANASGVGDCPLTTDGTSNRCRRSRTRSSGIRSGSMRTRSICEPARDCGTCRWKTVCCRRETSPAFRSPRMACSISAAPSRRGSTPWMRIRGIYNGEYRRVGP